MGPDIASPPPDAAAEASPRFRFGASLTQRILAVNALALLLLAGSIFYLDGFRTRLIDERRMQQESAAKLVATSLALTPRTAWPVLIGTLADQTNSRMRVYDRSGRLIFDSKAINGRSFALVDPAAERWQRHVARALDAAIDRLVGADIPPPYVDADSPSGRVWPEVAAILNDNDVASRVRLAPDRTTIVSAAAAVGSSKDAAVFIVRNARDATRLVRAERYRLGVVVLIALLLSAWLSLFLARTIVGPLRSLARAAVRVRLGRAREVVVPRLPERRDEIGLLARALSDMTAELRDRIDAVEHFAADVSHELKNPLASMRSAVDSFARVSDPALQAQLLDIMREDVHRLDRLITDIAEISRLDAELTRTPFQRIDLGAMIADLLSSRKARNLDPGTRIAFARPLRDTAVVAGDPDRLSRAIAGLIDNAVSFSPPDGVVRVGATRAGDRIIVSVEDEGPGVPIGARDAIFERFHSDRPANDGFGRHSGLGLPIARTIVEGHNGTIAAAGDGAATGARFVITLPAA